MASISAHPAVTAGEGGKADRLLHGVRTTILVNATAYGFSVMVTAAFAIANGTLGSPTTREIFLFAVGATSGFALVEAAATRGFRVRVRPEPSSVVALGSAMATLSVTLGLAAATLVAHAVAGPLGWFLSPAAATITFVCAAGLEMALARKAEERRDDDEETDETTPGDGVPDDPDEAC